MERKELGERLSSLSPDELEALLSSLSTADGSPQADALDMEKDWHGCAPVTGVFPATYAQILFWRQYDADRDASLNHQSMDFRIHGELDVEALKSSFQILSDSQPSLRTVYFEDERDVWQRIEPSFPIPFEFVDSVAVPDMEEFLKRPFKLESEPAIRVRLVKEGEDVHLLQIVMHHIASDGRSKVVMLQELSEYYDAIKAGRTPIAKTHATYLGRKAIEEREWLSGNGSSDATRHWEGFPFGEGLQHPWPAGRHRVSDLNTDSEASGRLKFDLGLDLSGKVRAFAAERGMTPLQLMMGCYLLCLQRLMPGSDVTVAMPVDMRGSEEEASLVGCLMNVVPVTMDAETPNSVDAYLSLAVERMRKAIEHARMPLYRILEIGHESDRMARTLSWKTLVNFKEDYADSLSLNGLTVQGLPFRQIGASVDVELTFNRSQETPGRRTISFSVDFDLKKISLSDTSALLETWRSVIDQCIDSQPASFLDIDILLPGERERLREFSGIDNPVSYPRDKTLVDLFEEQAERTPDAAALRFREEVLTYRELNERSNRLAHHIMDRIGSGTDRLVGIELPRSEWMVIGMLAIIKSGGAYVPLDPEYPSHRKDFIRQDADMGFILDSDELERFRTSAGQGFYPASNPCVPLRPDHLAYVIYTSGTTGHPKGVLIEHRNVVRLLFNDAFPFDFSRRDVWTLAHSYNFDFSVWEMYGALLYGGELVVVPTEFTRDADAFAGLLVDCGVTVLNQTPSAFYTLSESMTARPDLGGHRIRYVIFGGEALQPSRLAGWHSSFPETMLFNMYGITETTVHVTCKEIGLEDIEAGRSNIGRPIPTLSCFVLNEKKGLCALGQAGELHVGGLGLARGYLNREELTAEKFISNPFRSGERLYKSGDICRWREDGNLEYLGRMDDQVKIRGFRIELGEVEHALLACEGVRDAVVRPEPDASGSNRLRTWVTVKDVLGVDESSIRSSLSELLPGYMIPFRIHVIDSIPLTPHGKTDHRALRKLAELDAADAEAGLPLETETQHILAGLWSELLGVEVGSRDADFFRLGGHSLVAMRLAGRIQKLFGSTLSLPDFYRDGRLDRLATRIDTKVGEGDTFKRLSDMPALVPGERVPMSWAQRRMWMLQQLLSNPSSYHIAHVFTIPRERSASEVKSILESMADRHGILRTRLYHEDDGFWQEELQLSRRSLDWMELETDTQEEWTPLVLYEREQPFDLSKAPGWKARWVHLRGGEPMLLVVFHHALMDEWSMNLFKWEFDSLLSGSASNSESKKPSHSYIDFSRWQHWTFSQGLRERLEAYWKGRLSDLGEPVRLATDLVAKNGTAGRSASVTRPVDPSMRHSMETYCSREGLSRFAVWMSVWQILHLRLGSGEEVVIATPVSERDRPEWQDVMGMCMNTLPIRSKVDEDASFRSFSKKSHQSLASDLAHVQLPYEDIVRLADGDLGIEGHGLPQVMFAWHGEYEWSEEDGSDTGSPRKRSHAKNPLSIHIVDRSNACRISVVYDDGLFNERTAEKILLRYEAVARQVLENPDMRICDIDILLPGERERMMEFSGIDNSVSYPMDKTLVDLFEEQVERTPDATALRFRDTVLTYRELNERSNKLAHHLMTWCDSKPVLLVGIELPRSEWMVIGMLAIIKSGGAYVPIDPENPQQRKDFILRDAELEYILDGEQLDLFKKADVQAPYPTSNPRVSLRPENLVYIIYTSGTTGNPKGVMIEHRNVVRLLFNDAFPFDFNENDVWAFFHSYNFDVSVWEMYGALLYGGELVVVPYDATRDGRAFAELLIDCEVTVLNQIPSVFHVVSEYMATHPGAILHKIRFVIFAGEALHPFKLLDWKRSFPETRLVNMYGITETTVHATYKEIGIKEIEEGASNIGKPIPTLSCYVLNDRNELCVPGEEGELHVGGLGLARGYLNREELTAQRFIPNPFRAGERLYKSGDICRWREDGNLEYLGRMDDQVKIRGFRIELGEVEHALLSCDGVRDAVVRSEPDGMGSNRLRSWVRLKHGFSESESSIRSSLMERLPDYMIPSRIHFIASIPLTSNGKTDHRALRALAEQVGEEAEGLPLTTSAEHRLAAIWSELLGVEVLRRDADFFRLGGHSLIAMRLAGRIRKEFGVTVSLPDFYRDGRLDRFAERIDAGENHETKNLALSDMPAPVPGERVPMSGSQRRMWMLQQLLSNPSSYHIARVFPIPRERSATEVKSILTSMADRHGILRTRLWQDDQGFWQEELPQDGWKMDWGELEAATPEECIEHLSGERERMFDLSNESGWRARWVQERDREPRLLLVFHHALMDEWSMNLFRKEFDALLTGKRSVEGLTRSAHDYIDFSRWQHWTFSQGLRERLEAYWKGRLSDLGEPVRLATDLVAKNGTAGRSASVTRPVDPSMRHSMETYCKREGLSRFAVWMAVWQILQSRLGSGEEVVIATPVSERDRPEWQDVMGMCLNTLPILSKVDEDASFRSFSRKSHQSLTGDLEHGQLPYEDIVPLADGDLGIEGHGLPQVMFAWHDEYEWSRDDGSDTGSPSKRSHAKNPLSIHIVDRSNACRISVVYDDGLFNERTAEKILLRYEAVARQVLVNPDIRIADIDILLPGERERLHEFSGRDRVVAYPETTLHEIFRQTALRYPNSPAVIDSDGNETTYSQLREQTNNVTCFLRSIGIDREAIVAVHMQSSPRLLAAILGVLDSGGAFLLMEPGLPLGRLRVMAEQARVSAVITDEGMPLIPGCSDRTYRFHDTVATHATSIEDVVKTDDSCSLAYVMFTSGTTGTPKGAMVEHRNAVNYLRFLRENFGFGPDDRTLHRPPLSFDVCIFKLLLPMTAGGAVVFAEPGRENDTQHIADRIVEHRVSAVEITPAVLKGLLEVPDIEKVNGILRNIICGGEAMSDSLLVECRSRVDATLYNGYGPAETAVAVTLWRCSHNHPYPKPPIGTPFTNVSLLVMDAKGRPVPPGMPGELWIGGAQTGRGYINNEEETKKRFVDDPIDTGSGRRYYRTGDLARFLPDGNILFLGRMDDQLKVRGVRIELGDVTAALLRCEGVREAVVIAEPDGEGSNRLRGWVTTNDASVVSESSIRSSMTEILPGYMIPFRIHVIDSIPLTLHGKTDHRALRTMAENEGDDTEGLPLETPTEHRLAEMWSELLGNDVKYRDADFFRLGGHSLIALRMSARIQKVFGVAVSLPDFYRDGLLVSLATHIDAGVGEGGAVMRLSDMPAPVPGERVPMSWAQRRMWMLQQILSDPSSYHIAHVFQIPEQRTALDVKSILESIADRYGILRTRLWQDDEGFWQEELPLDEWRIDWTELNAASEEECIELLSEARERIFDLSDSPVWRARWMTQNDREPFLLLVFHHALVDEWSMNLFGKEFDALLTGKSSVEELTRPAHSYIEFSRWQHWTFSEGLRERLETYWKERLSNLGEPVRLSADLVPGDGTPGRSATVRRPVESTTRHLMEAYCRSEGLSRFAVWMAVWQILHSRLGSGEEVVLATPVSERERPEWQDVMGMCLNTLPIRAKVDEQASFRSFSRSGHGRLARDLAYGQLPYEDIVRLADGDLGTGGQGLPQVMFVWHGEYDWSGDDGSESVYPWKRSRAKNPISIHITDRSSACRISIVYDDGLFEERTAEKILLRYEAVARQLLDNPDIRIADIDILLPGEREHILELSGRDNKVEYLKTTLHGIFRQTAERYPERPAVIEADGRETSYEELQRQVDRIAGFLRSKGVGCDVVVGVHMQRSHALMAAILGILEAGGAFFLMEPSIPLDRLRAMSEQAHVAAVITDEGMPAIPGFIDRSHVYCDIINSESAVGGLHRTVSDPASLACVIFTSGSTGIPKGVMLEHVNLVNYLLFLRDVYDLGPEDRTLQKTTLSFDVSLYELLLPMTTGGAVVMSQPGLENDSAHIVDMVLRHHATYLCFAPAQLRFFLGDAGLGKLNGTLKIVQCAGEALDGTLMEQCLSILNARLSNAYGPAEAGAVTQWICDKDHPYPKPPIGTPNPNVDILIMDSMGHLVPPGLPGELWVGGAQTGRGYINNGEETRKRFVDDPIEPGSGRRYYRTGDLAQFLPDGNILFHGRMDDQVKVRGVRIELGDVKATLLKCESVREAVVLAEPDGEGSNRLHAWVTLNKGIDGDESAIRSSLMELLPGYMIPFRIHVIDSIPLTTNGKTDHRALRVLAEKIDDDIEGLPLTTPTEQKLAEIWSKLLGVGVRYRDADFFRLGGHSLVAMRLSALVRKEYDVSVSLSDFFADGRLDSLAARIDKDRGAGEKGLGLSDMPALQPGERVPMSWSQRRMWMLQHMLANPSSYHIAHVFQVPRHRTALDVKSILTSMAERHGILRTRLFQEDDTFWQEELSVDAWEMDWAELDASSQEECIGLLSEERERTFDLSKSPGWRARWMIQDDREPIMLLVFHHALVDEWSMNLFRKEFDSLLTGKASVEELTRPAHSYIEFSRWQHWTFSEGLRERLETYWKERLYNLGESVRLSADLVPGDGTAGRSATVGRPVESGTRRLMEDYCRSEGLSRFAVWMAVWQILHSRLGSGEEVVLATPVSERERPEWQDVMGMCLNTLPIRAKVDEQASFRSFSRSGHGRLARDLAYGQLPYEDIVRLADGDLGTGGQGLPQVMFVWHGEYEWSQEDGSASGSPGRRSHAKNLVSIHITDRSEVCRMSITYDDSLLLEQTAEKILLRYESVARQVMENPDMRIAEIDILLPGEREHILELSGRDNKVEYLKTTLHGIFRQTAERYPERPAVIEADGRATTYDELLRQVDKVSSFLRAMGIGKEAVVAVHMHRSSNLLASMLGILEAGGAFFLMEPSLPLDRLRNKSEQARVAALITDEGMPVLPGLSDRTHYFGDILSAENSTDLIHRTQPDHASLACVIFTSGSTGIPKGAMLEHGNLLNYLEGIREAYSFGIEDRTLQKTLLSFDASLIELLLPMTAGGSVVMPGPGVEADIQGLAGLAELHRVSYLFFAPAQLRLFLEVPRIERLNGSLKVVACGGESVSDSLVAAHLETLRAQLYQIYGPTETSIAVAQWNCRSGHGHPKPPLGRPNANVDILIMDAHGRPVPPGMPGELWIGGAQTGRGYINNEEETRKRFVDDPSEPGSGRRYYRTGDLAKFLPDGNLLFLGRMDDQLKVRGVRIELGDVTAALLRCEGVMDAVVLSEPDGEDSNRLRGWVTLKHGFEGGESAIRSSLMDLLPGYMIPFRIHVMETVPLTTHGKTDHRALRAMSEDETADTEVLPIATATEQRLAAIWSDLLGVDVTSRDADFFRLGGHSLLVIRLLDVIKSRWGFRPDISAVFMDPSLESMARSIDSGIEPKESSQHDYEIVPVKAWDSGRGRHVFAFVGGAGSEEEFTKYHLIGRVLGKGWRIYILPDPETSKGRFPTIGLDRLAKMYAKALVPFCREEGVWLMGNCIGGQDAFAVACELQSAGVAKPGLILVDTPFPTPRINLQGKAAEGLESYRDLPESASPVDEFLFRSFMWLARVKSFRSLFHFRPRSRGQVLAMAMEYGLFDPVDYSLRCPGSGRTSKEAFHRYLTEGRLKGEPPSGRFNGYRYAKQVDGFDLRGDDPVLHALLVGFREGYPRRRVLAYVETPNMKSDIMSARREVRIAFDVPVKYEGKVHFIVNSEFLKHGRSPGWQRHVEGRVQVHRVEGDHMSILKEKLVDTARTIGRILDGDG